MSQLENTPIEILVVDNTPDNLVAWCKAIEQATGCRPFEATTEGDAGRFLETRPVDICVVDLFLSQDSERSKNLEESEGLRLIQVCRRRHPHSRIIAITTKLGDSAVGGAEAFRKGADDFISSAWPHVYADALLQEKVRIFQELLRSQRERLSL